MQGKFDSILATVGRTPVIRLNKLAPNQVNVFVKVEAFNPMGSVKDRLALGIIEDAEKRGLLKPDYLSTPLFDGIGADMSDEELEISRSTPSARFDKPVPTAAPAPAATSGEAAPAPAAACAIPAKTESNSAAVAVSKEVEDFVAQVLADAHQPLVLFALEWCEFCWSLRKLFAQASIPYRSIDLDSTAYQADDRGGQIRAVLRARIGSPTIPQVFVGGEHVGGCTDTMDAYKSGQLQALLASRDVAFDADAAIDPHGLLPGWLQSR